MNIVGQYVANFLASPDTGFVVPFYQRNYSWEESQCAQLFADICNQIGKTKIHFLGSVCFQRENNNGEISYIIIDGQQRIASLSLFLLALRHFTNDYNLLMKIDSYLFINDIMSQSIRIKLRLQEDDDKVYHKIIKISSHEDVDITDDDKQSLLYKNYLFFQQQIAAAFPAADKGDLYTLTQCLSQLEIASIEIQDENPQLIFESLNCTGLNLTQVDLIRNYLLMPLNYTQQEEMYSKYWANIERNVDDIEAFFITYLVLRKQGDQIILNGKKVKITKWSLYEAFKQEFPDMNKKYTEKIQECFVDMYECSKLYKQVMEASNGELDELKGVEKTYFELFRLFQNRNAMPLIIGLYSLYQNNPSYISEKDYSECLMYIASYIFRSKVCRISDIGTQFAASVIRQLSEQVVDETFMERFKRALCSGSGKYRFPSDEEFVYSLKHEALYETLKSALVKYLLYELEKNEAHSKELPPYSKETITVEHIMPRSMPEVWENELFADGYDAEVINRMHTLGNLTLTGYNSELSNHSFAEKKKEYAQSAYKFTREIANYEKWNKETIDKRAEELAEKCLKRWPGIAGQEIKENEKYNLLIDFGLMTGRKPQRANIFGKEKEYNTWHDIARDIYDELYQMDPELFRKMEAI